MEIQIEKGHISTDHVHLLVSVPPYISVSEMMKRTNGRTSRKLLGENKGLKRAFSDQHLWARGYFATTTGNGTDELPVKYTEERRTIE